MPEIHAIAAPGRKIICIEIYLKIWVFVTGILLFTFLPAFSISQNGNIVLEYHTNIKIEKGKHIKETSILIQINNKNSDWVSDVEIAYGEDEKMEILEAVILNTKGDILRKLKKKEIISRSDISRGTFYENNFIKEFKLKWHQYPYHIKYSYRKTAHNFLYITKWYPVLYKNIPVQKASLKVQLPKEYEVYMDYSDSLKHHTDVLANHLALSWEGSYSTQLKSEAFGINFREKLPNVTIVPKIFHYGIEGQFDSWSSYGKWHAQINTGLDELTESEKIVVDKLIEGLHDKKEIAKKLYQYMQANTRYINVTIDEGGLVPYPASYVCANKYGDCKALTIYMKALLKHAGIASYYTIIFAGSNPVRVNKSFPSQQFNHVILNVPLEEDTIWLENTANYLPFNYLGTSTQNRTALMIDGKDSRLIRTPRLIPDEVLEESQYSIHLNNEGNGTLKASKILRGSEFEAYKYLSVEISEKDHEDYIRKKLPIKNIDQIDWSISQPDSDQAMLLLDLSVTMENQFRMLGKSIAFSLFPIYSSPFKKHKTRTGDIRINYPIYKSDSIVIDLPFINQYQVKLPKEIAIESEYGLYEESYSLKDNKIHVTRYFKLYANDYPLEEYPEFYAFMKSINETQLKSIIVLNPN